MKQPPRQATEPVAYRVWNRMGGISYRTTKPSESEYVEWDALYTQVPDETDALIIRYHEETIKRLRKALAKISTKQTPVAWLEPEFGEQICPEVGYEYTITSDHPMDLCWIPLYPKREWVGLTEDEINEVLGGDIRDEPSGELRFIRAIEAKLKEKNT